MSVVHLRHEHFAGAGTGIASLTLCAVRSAKAPSDEGCIITTDLGEIARLPMILLVNWTHAASAMPLLEHNISANETLFRSPSARPEALVLDWDDERLPERLSVVKTGFNAIM